MSKFFKGAVSSSDSSDSEESVDVPQRVAPQKHLVRDFAYPSDSDDERPKRVVRASKDKMYDELKEQIRLARNARKIKDVTSLLASFETLCRLYEKVKTIIAREGLTIPRFYIRYLAEVQDFVNDLWDDKEARRVMSKVNSKNLASLRQKVRKYIKDYESEVNTYREGPDPIGYSSGAAEDDDDEIESVAKESERLQLPVAAALTKAKKKRDKDLDEDSESDWDSDSSDTSSESDIDFEGKQMEDLRKFFLKKDKPGKSKTKEKERRHRETKQKVETEEDDENEEGWKKITHKDDAQKPLFHSKAEINLEMVLKKLVEINSNRGRKSTNRKIHVRNLQELYKIADEHNMGVGVLGKILAFIISALFELNTRISDAMEFNSWLKTVETIDGFFNLLLENSNVIISILVNEDEENLMDLNAPLTIHGSPILMVKRLSDELTKIYQNTDCHSTDYIEKLKGEKVLYDLIKKAQCYVDSRRSSNVFDTNEVIIIYMLHIEHLYYKYSPSEDTCELMNSLCKVIYAMGAETMQQRQRAMLCQIYHYAIHDRWQEAKNCMLMSHMQAIVDHSDASTQVLYNRTICQLGLCAFRHGFIREAHQGLSEIQNTQRAKELLAQGIPPRQIDKTPEQDLKERALQVPYHMHINLELMECVYLICSMLLEIPNIACHEYDLRRHLLSRSFHYQLKFSEKAALIGPPENTREHVVAASRAMLKGDWLKCRDYIINDKMNAKVWNLFRNTDAVKSMVVTRIQEDTLRTYLLMYSTVYETVSLKTLCELFELAKVRVYAIISKMIIQEELSATLDEPTDCLIMHRVEPSRLQLLALNLADKLSQLIDNNEQSMEPRTGRVGYMGPGGRDWYAQRGATGTGGQDRQGDGKGRRTTYQQCSRYNPDGKRNAWGNPAQTSAALGRGFRSTRPRY